MFEIIGIAVVVWIIWVVLKAIGRTATNQAYHQGAAANMSLADAKAALQSAEEEFIGSFSRGRDSASVQQNLLDKAASLNDRVGQLSNMESGPESRAIYRADLMKKANRVRSFMDKVGPPKNHRHSFSSFDSWLDKFKDGAGVANELLAKTDKGCLIDFMDISPLRRAYEQGVEPYQLGMEFGEQFDYGKFLGGAHATREDGVPGEIDYSELIRRYRNYARMSNRAPSPKTSDKQIIDIYETIASEFTGVARQRNEEISEDTINGIVLKFLQMHESFGREMFEQHLEYELQKYEMEGLRPDYKQGLKLP